MPALQGLSEYCLKKGDKKKADFTENPEVLAELNHVRREVERALANTEYFHGTGRKHYNFKGESQYDGIDHRVVVDRLPSLAKDGLRPQADLFSENFTGDGEARTVSLSKNRMYSRVYADLHMNENDGYGYEYGSQAFWWYYMLYLMIITGMHDKSEWKAKFENARSQYKLVWNSNLKSIKNIAVQGQKIPGFVHICNAFLFVLQYLYFKKDPLWRDQSNNDKSERDKREMNAIEWIGRFRSDRGGVEETQSPRKKARLYNKFATHGRSDIPGNYGMIIGIKKGKVQKKPIKRNAVCVFETRAQNTLESDTWSYIEVPMAEVEKTRQDLQKVFSEADLGKLDTPIYATEHVEMMMREKSLAELAKKDEK